MPSVSMRQLLEAGVHFGHQTRRWNPKMRPYIFAERNGIHIIDLAADRQAPRVVARLRARDRRRGEHVLFVGTKKQAQEPIAQEATRAGQPYVNKRWLGGMLTNFTTIKKRIGLLEQLEARQQAGDFERLSKKEAAKLNEELAEASTDRRRDAQDEARPGRRLHHRPASRADRRHRGEQARGPGRRDRRHERRPRRDRPHHPGQRRRHPGDPPALHPDRRRLRRGPAGARRPCGRGAGARAGRGGRAGVRRVGLGRAHRGPRQRRAVDVLARRGGGRRPAARRPAARRARGAVAEATPDEIAAELAREAAEKEEPATAG